MIAIHCQSTDAYFNLAMEDILFHHLPDGERAVLLWQNAPSVVVGKFQNAFAEVNMPFVHANGLGVARRISGGGAVYHDLGNLNYSFFTPNPGHHAVDYHPFTAPIIRALKALGVDAQHNERNDLTIEGRKISGNAQHITRQRILHHGTLLFKSNLDHLTAALLPPDAVIDTKATQSVRSRVTNIADHLPESVSLEDFRQAIYAQLDSADDPLTFRNLTAAEVSAIGALAQEKYGQWDWNFGKSPRFTIRRQRRLPTGRLAISLEVLHGTIQACSLAADTLDSTVTAALEQQLLGRRLREEDLAQACGHLPAGLAPSDFLNLLLP